MTPRITLIIGTALAALTIVPAAFGEGRLAGSPGPAAAPDWFERAALVAESNTRAVVRPDSHDIIRSVGPGYLDAADRALRIDVVVPTAYADAFERSAPPRGAMPTSVASESSGSDRDWSQLGIGFGIGLLLAIGLYLAMRFTRIRTFAH